MINITNISSFILKQISNHLVHLLSFEADIAVYCMYHDSCTSDNSWEMMQADGLQIFTYAHCLTSPKGNSLVLPEFS